MRDWFWHYFSQTGDPEGYLIYLDFSKLDPIDEMAGPSVGQGTDMDDSQNERCGDPSD